MLLLFTSQTVMAVADVHGIATSPENSHGKQTIHSDHDHLGKSVAPTKASQDNTSEVLQISFAESDLDCQHCCHCHSKTPIVISNHQDNPTHIHYITRLFSLTYAPVQGIEFPHIRPPINTFSS